jgi:salicylate hydroxylase
LVLQFRGERLSWQPISREWPVTSRQVLIAGGGIGGLTASLCLAKRGFDVIVFEQSPELVAIGAGIQLSPNCARVLHDLGLELPLRACAFLPEGTQFRDWRSGRVIADSVLGETALKQYGAPYYHIHRGDLLRVLSDAVNSSPNVTLKTDAQVAAFSQSPAGVEVKTAQGAFAGDALIGADGIHSAVRTGLWGEQIPSFTGNIAWRALVPTERLPKNLIRPMASAWWGPGKHFVHYYVRGGALVNCVCVVEKQGWEVESWTESGELSEIKADFAGWHDDIQQLIDHADSDSLFKWALYDRSPMSRWGQGRVSLLGDACHPTLPFMAQGAAMAIEDAAVLAGCLGGASIEKGLDRYENLRRARTTSIQKGSRRNAKVFHLSGMKAWLRNKAVRAAGNRVMDQLFSYNALDVADQAMQESIGDIPLR